MSPDEIDSNTYWRAIVREIRNSKNGRVWLKVNWFYSREHLLQPGILDQELLVPIVISEILTLFDLAKAYH
jgi:hypothetical protein